MNRFENNKKASVYTLWSIISSAFILIALCIFLYHLHFAPVNSSDDQLNHLRNIVTKDIVQCYALEGTYPPNLEYLETHYGLHYDKNMFYIDYISIGANLFPDVSIIIIE